MSNHFHFIIWAANGKTETGYSEVTYVDIIEENEKKAIERAKKLAPGRKHYWVNNILEHHDHADSG